MSIVELLQRTDYYEITGNRMTSYCTSLGGGSITYWDGRQSSFASARPLGDLTAFVQVMDREHGINLLQQVYHYWRPDKVVSKFISHGNSYIEEEKTIWDDTFISVIDLHSENAQDLVIRIDGAIAEESQVGFRDNLLIIEEISSGSSIFKVVGFNFPTDCSIDGRRYTLEFPLSLEASLEHERARREKIVLIVAAGDSEGEALERFSRAMREPESLFTARRQEWERYFEENVPRFSCDNPAILKMYYFICYMMKSNIYNFGAGCFKHPFESTAKFRLLAQWFWDSAFGAMNEKWLNGLPMPKSSTSNTLEAQREDGLLPFSLCLDKYHYGDWEIIQPFILPMAIWDYYLKSGDREFIEKALPVLIGFDKWMMANRDQNGEQLVNLKVPGESGWDNSKRYVLGSRFVQEESPLVKENRFVQSPDFNTYVYIGRKIISKIASELGTSDVLAEYQALAEKSKAGIEDMWSDEMGLYMDRFELGHERIPVRTPGGAIPMLAGIPDRDQVARIVANLTDTRLFWTRYPLTTLDLGDPDYNTKDEYFSYWNGRVWPPINWLIAEGLARVGQCDVARELVRLSIRMCSATGEPWCSENYHPETGYPYLTNNTFNYIWGGIFLDMLLRRVAGIQPNAPKDEVLINPLMNEDICHLSVDGIIIGDHSVGIELTKVKEGVRLRFTHSGKRAITLVTSAGSNTVEDTAVELIIDTFSPPHWLEM